MLALGFDIGGTNLKSIFWKDGQIKQKSIDSLPKDLPSLLDLIKDIFDECSESFGRPQKVGIATAALVDKKGKIILAPNIPYLNGKNLLEKIKRCTGMKKITACHDSHAFLRAELDLNKKIKSKNILFVALGTGIGGAFTVNGRLIEDTENWPGEVGKAVLDLRTGRTLEQLGGSQFLKSSLKVKSIMEAKIKAVSGDSKALIAFEKMGANLGVGLAGAVNLLGSDTVVLGGGLIETKKFWLQFFKRSFKANLIGPKKSKTKIIISVNGIFGGAIGSII